MKKNRAKTLLYLIVLVCFNCKNNETTPKIVLDYSLGSGWAYSYSIKIYANGTSYLKKNSLTDYKDLFFIENMVNVDRLNAIILKMKERKLVDRYEQKNIQDASCFNIILYDNDGKTSKHYVYGNDHPELLDAIRTYCDSLERGKKWNRLRDTVITFVSVADLSCIPKIDSNMHFLPPLPSQPRRSGKLKD